MRRAKAPRSPPDCLMSRARGVMSQGHPPAMQGRVTKCRPCHLDPTPSRPYHYSLAQKEISRPRTWFTRTRVGGVWYTPYRPVALYHMRVLKVPEVVEVSWKSQAWEISLKAKVSLHQAWEWNGERLGCRRRLSIRDTRSETHKAYQASQSRLLLCEPPRPPAGHSNANTRP